MPNWVKSIAKPVTEDEKLIPIHESENDAYTKYFNFGAITMAAGARHQHAGWWLNFGPLHVCPPINCHEYNT